MSLCIFAGGAIIGSLKLFPSYANLLRQLYVHWYYSLASYARKMFKNLITNSEFTLDFCFGLCKAIS